MINLFSKEEWAKHFAERDAHEDEKTRKYKERQDQQAAYWAEERRKNPPPPDDDLLPKPTRKKPIWQIRAENKSKYTIPLKRDKGDYSERYESYP